MTWNTFRITCPLWGESTVVRCIPHGQRSLMRVFLLQASVELPNIWDASKSRKVLWPFDSSKLSYAIWRQNMVSTGSDNGDKPLPALVLTCCQLGLTLIWAWINNHIPSNMWDEITFPFPNCNGCTFEVWEWISNFIPHFIMGAIVYPCWDLC